MKGGHGLAKRERMVDGAAAAREMIALLGEVPVPPGGVPKSEPAIDTTKEAASRDLLLVSSFDTVWCWKDTWGICWAVLLCRPPRKRSMLLQVQGKIGHLCLARVWALGSHLLYVWCAQWSCRFRDADEAAVEKDIAGTMLFHLLLICK